MDLRILRTKKCIQDAFIEIRKKKDIEKITVTEIAQKALINKATFYNHYESVYDLSDKMETEAIDSIIKLIPPKEWETVEGTKHLAIEMQKNREYLTLLFSGSRYGYFSQKLEKQIKEEIYSCYPKTKNIPEKDILLTIMIYGGFYTMHRYEGEEFDKAIEILAKLNDYVIKGFYS